jgi:hypothetical protein
MDSSWSSWKSVIVAWSCAVSTASCSNSRLYLLWTQWLGQSGDWPLPKLSYIQASLAKCLLCLLPLLPLCCTWEMLFAGGLFCLKKESEAPNLNNPVFNWFFTAVFHDRAKTSTGTGDSKRIHVTVLSGGQGKPQSTTSRPRFAFLWRVFTL